MTHRGGMQRKDKFTRSGNLLSGTFATKKTTENGTNKVEKSFFRGSEPADFGRANFQLGISLCLYCSPIGIKLGQKLDLS